MRPMLYHVYYTLTRSIEANARSDNEEMKCSICNKIIAKDTFKKKFDIIDGIAVNKPQCYGCETKANLCKMKCEHYACVNCVVR